MNGAIVFDGFKYQVEVVKDGRVIVPEQTHHNVIPQEALTHIAGMLLATGVTPNNWYVGVFEGAYVPSAASVAADLPGAIGECVSYSETSRPAWSAAHDDSDNSITMAAPVEMTLNADKTITGSFLVSSPTKGSGSGKLLSAVRFSTPYVLTAGSILRVRPFISLLTAQVG
jgi:hypothetical protein